MAEWKKVVVSGSSAELAGLTVDATITGDISGNAGGNAATATALETARNIGGVSFDGTANINLPGVNTAGSQDTSGTAATATALETARTIGGVSFDGTANINLPGVNAAGNQDTSGNAATATALETARNLQVSLGSTSADSFDGSGNATSIGVSGTLGTAQGGLGFVPTISAGNAGKIIKVNNAGNAFELADDEAGSVTADSATTFSNKTINSSNNTLTIAQSDVTGLSTALSGKQDTISAGDLAISDTSGLQSALDAKAPLASPTFTGTVAGISKGMVGLGNVDNTSDVNKPISTAQQTALDLKAPLASPTFTGTVAGISKGMVGLGNVDNTSDVNKPISTAQQTEIDTKQDTIDASARLSATLIGDNGDVSNTEFGFLNGVTSAIQTQLNEKLGANNTALTGTTTAVNLNVSGDQVIAGNLTVQGTASFQDTENLKVADKFIALASGSAGATDGGIVVEQSSVGGGKGAVFAFDGISTGRWGVDLDFNPSASAYTPAAFMSNVVIGGGVSPAASAPATAYVKAGNIYAATDESLWIYSA